MEKILNHSEQQTMSRFKHVCSTVYLHSTSIKTTQWMNAVIVHLATPATVNLVLNATPARIAPAAAKNSARPANTVKQEEQQTKARRARIARRVVTKFPVAKPSVPSATLADTRTKRAK
jgi:hypothetical protein